MQALFSTFIFHKARLIVPLHHWSQTQFLEGHSSAQLSSNPIQTHLIQLVKLFRITRNFQAGVSWSWLELNCAELWPSRNWVWDQCFTCIKPYIGIVREREWESKKAWFSDVIFFSLFFYIYQVTKYSIKLWYFLHMYVGLQQTIILIIDSSNNY